MRSVSEKFVDKIIKESKNEKYILFGTGIDPGINELYEITKYLLNKIKNKDICLIFQTKNPKFYYDIINELNFPAERINIKCSFSFFNDKDTQFIEPFAPSVNERAEYIKKLNEIGVECIFRMQPLIFNQIEFLEKYLLESGCKYFICEPLRVNKPGLKYFIPMEKAMGCSIEEYFKMYGNKNNKFYGSMHWYDYNDNFLLDIYKKVKNICEKNGVSFGICSGVLGAKFARLNTNNFCCKTKMFDKIKLDNNALCSIINRREENCLKVQILQESSGNCRDYEVNLSRIGWINDKNFILKE